MTTLNSSLQWKRHVEGRRHRQFVVQRLRSQLASVLKERGVSAIRLSDFDDSLSDSRDSVREAFGGFVQLGTVPWSGLIVSRDDRSDIVVGLRPRRVRNSIPSLTDNVGTCRPPSSPVSVNDAIHFGNGESNEEDNVPPQLEDEAQFPLLGEVRTDPLLHRLRQLRLVPSGALEPMEERPQCDICWGSIAEGQRVVLLPCGHNDLCASCFIGCYRQTTRKKWKCYKCRTSVEDFYTEDQQRRALKSTEKRLHNRAKAKKKIERTNADSHE